VEPATVASVELAGDGTVLTQDPAYLVPNMDAQFDPVVNERITSEVSFNIVVSNDMQPNGYRAGRRFVALTNSSGNVIDDSGPPIAVRGGQGQAYSYAGGMTSEGVAWNVAGSVDGRVGSTHTSIDIGGYTGGTVGLITDRWGWAEPSAETLAATGTGMYLGLMRTGAFEITWSNSGGNVTATVRDRTHGADVPFSPYIDTGGWGFMPPGVDAATYRGEWGLTWGGSGNVETPQGQRTTLLVQTLPANNTEDFHLWVNGQSYRIFGVSAMPANGATWVVRTALGSWNGNTFVQTPDVIQPGDTWKFEVNPMTLDPQDADLSRIKVVPNPYMASSFLDLSPANRRVEFVNLPSECTIRIYTLSGNLVNVLNHIGINRNGWGNYTDFDRLQPGTGDPTVFSGYDNHTGTEPWNLRNRFGQIVASGLYLFHVTDQRGETFTGKFYIVN
jgi:hypothetical protein